MDAIAQSNPLAAIDDRFVFRGARRQHVAFPLGGIGSGSISLTGSGRLVDWSIRNRPAIHHHNGYSHFAIKAERDGELVDARVLNGPYEGLATGSPSRRKFDGYGFGANRNSMAGVPHFDDAVFVGRFPVAEIEFIRDAFPGKVRMTAFSPFIPHNERDTSMPAALFSFAIENDTDAPIDYTVAATLGNYGCDSGVHSFSRSGPLSALHFTSADVDRPQWQRGDLALTTEGDGVEHVDYHVRGQWFDSLSRYWREFARPGPLRERRYEEPRPTANMFQQPEHGTLARRVRVAPGARARVRFAITWNYPTGAIYWFNRSGPGEPEYSGEPPTWRNYYATQWAEFARERGRGVPPLGRAGRRDRSLPRLAVRLIDALRDYRRGVRHAWRAAQRHRHSPRRRRALGLGGPAHRRGVLRRQLHPCLELPAGARLAVPQPGENAARDRVRLQSAAERRTDVPPAPAARLRFRHHRPLRRRALRRDGQGLSRMAQFRRRRLA